MRGRKGVHNSGVLARTKRISTDKKEGGACLRGTPKENSKKRAERKKKKKQTRQEGRHTLGKTRAQTPHCNIGIEEGP